MIVAALRQKAISIRAALGAGAAVVNKKESEKQHHVTEPPLSGLLSD